MIKYYFAGAVVAALAGLLLSCAPSAPAAPALPRLVVTTSVLGSLVRDLAGPSFEVRVLLPDGQDPHGWEPSARDIEALTKAVLIVRNGLNLEGGLAKSLDRAAAEGVPFFTAADHLTVRRVGPGEGLPSGDPDQEVGAPDPHLWLAPNRLRSVVRALADELRSRFGTDLSARAADLEARLTALDTETKTLVATLAPARRHLVTGHESLGYFAEDYGFTLVGAVIPSLSDQAEVSAADLAALRATLTAHPVPVIFTENGTPPKVVEALAQALKVKAVSLTTHALGPDGDYAAFFRTLARTVVRALQGTP